MSTHPELDKLRAAAKKSQIIEDFIDWLDEQGIHLAEYVLVEGICDPILMPRTESTVQLLARFFDINLNKVEAKRRQLLDELRNGSA